MKVDLADERGMRVYWPKIVANSGPFALWWLCFGSTKVCFVLCIHSISPSTCLWRTSPPRYKYTTYYCHFYIVRSKFSNISFFLVSFCTQLFVPFDCLSYFTIQQKSLPNGGPCPTVCYDFCFSLGRCCRRSWLASRCLCCRSHFRYSCPDAFFFPF